MKDDALPEDLSKLKRWGDSMIAAATDLLNYRQHNQSRTRLIELLQDPPSIPAGVARELTIGSDAYQQESPTSIGGVLAGHPIDAIREFGWRALEAYLRKCKHNIDIHNALDRIACEGGSKPTPDYVRRGKGVAAIECFLNDRQHLSSCLPAIEQFFKSPLFGVGKPPPDRRVPSNPSSELERSLHELSILLEKVINRIWCDRSPGKASEHNETDDTDQQTPLQSSKKRRSGRPKKTNPEQDAIIAKRWNETRDRYLTHAEFARVTGLAESGNEVMKAIDRHRKRQK